MSLTDDAHALITEHVNNTTKNLAIDATCGNGHDTLFLADLGFKKVIGMDVQACAIKSSEERIKDKLTVTLIHDSHINLAKYGSSKAECIMFNFGYLPSGNKDLTTQPETSLIAINAGLSKLSDDGLMTLMCYPGHPQGKKETQLIKDLLASLDKENWHYETHLAVSPKPTAPILFSIKKRAQTN